MRSGYIRGLKRILIIIILIYEPFKLPLHSDDNLIIIEVAVHIDIECTTVVGIPLIVCIKVVIVAQAIK